MKIETKFDLNQEVYYISDSKQICSGIIYNIKWDSVKGFDYFIPMLQLEKFRIPESELFTTQEEAEKKLKEIREEV